MNGKLGDHPLNDILDHGAPRFSPEIDELVRQLAALVPRYRLFEMFDWLNASPSSEFRVQLQTEVDRLTKDARARGWDIS
jgi:hypothetical protein